MTAVTYTATEGLDLQGTEVGAWLADTEAGNVTGVQLVTNGGFPTNTAGWTAGNGATLASVAGELRITADGTSYSFARQAVTGLVIGQAYVVRCIARRGTCVADVAIQSSDVDSAQRVTTSSGSSVQISFTFVADAASKNIDCVIFGATTAGETAYFDDVSCVIASADLSATNQALEVVGTLTKTAVATGAELVSYSGWGVSNYLSRVYGADLDITDQITLMAWVKPSSFGGHQSIAGNLQGPTGDSGGCFIALSPSGYLRFSTADNTGTLYDLYDTTSLFVADKWAFVVATLTSAGAVSLYKNGALIASQSGFTMPALTAEVFKVGVVYYSGITNPFSGNIAGVRVINGVLTAAQILNIYNREKSLFQNYAPFRQIGTSYSLDLKASSITRSESPVSNSVRSLGGAQETIFIRRDTNYACAFTDIHITELPAIRNFIHSIEAGETFTFDAYGNTTTADNPLSVIADPGYSEPRMEFSEYFIFSLNVREV